MCVSTLAPSQPITRLRDYLSYSALATYWQCPLRYYFRYVAQLPEPTVAASLVFGRAIHAAIERHYLALLTDSQPPPLEELHSAYDQAWQDEPTAIEFSDAQDRTKLDQLADSVLRAFQQSPLAQPTGAIVGLEEELRGSLLPGVPDLLARIDLLCETDDALLVSDFKTSRSAWSAAQVEEAAVQLLLYGLLVQRLAPQKRLRLRFGVLTKTRQPSAVWHEVPATPQQLHRARTLVGRVWQAISAGHFYPAPAVQRCASCPFRAPCARWPQV